MKCIVHLTLMPTRPKGICMLVRGPQRIALTCFTSESTIEDIFLPWQWAPFITPSPEETFLYVRLGLQTRRVAISHCPPARYDSCPPAIPQPRTAPSPPSAQPPSPPVLSLQLEPGWNYNVNFALFVRDMRCHWRRWARGVGSGGGGRLDPCRQRGRPTAGGSRFPLSVADKRPLTAPRPPPVTTRSRPQSRPARSISALAAVITIIPFQSTLH